jgi:hypothetical protein
VLRGVRADLATDRQSTAAGVLIAAGDLGDHEVLLWPWVTRTIITAVQMVRGAYGHKSDFVASKVSSSNEDAGRGPRSFTHQIDPHSTKHDTLFSV